MVVLGQGEADDRVSRLTQGLLADASEDYSEEVGQNQSVSALGEGVLVSKRTYTMRALASMSASWSKKLRGGRRACLPIAYHHTWYVAGCTGHRPG